MILKGITTLNASNLKHCRKFSGHNLSWREYRVILRLMSGADNEIKHVCKCHRDGCPEKASTGILLSPKTLKYLLRDS